MRTKKEWKLRRGKPKEKERGERKPLIPMTESLSSTRGRGLPRRKWSPQRLEPSYFLRVEGGCSGVPGPGSSYKLLITGSEAPIISTGQMGTGTTPLVSIPFLSPSFSSTESEIGEDHVGEKGRKENPLVLGLQAFTTRGYVGSRLPFGCHD